MASIEHAQTVLTDKELIALKKKTGQESTKEALRVAVEHTIATYQLVK